ncbi:MAG: NB-ARC domain-containing protein [Terrimicrobiaceae bacterium]
MVLLTGAAPGFTSEQEGKDALRQALEGRPLLVVLDDVWSMDHAAVFAVTAPPTRLVVTTRNSEVIVRLEAEEHRLDVLSPSEALTKDVGEVDLDLSSQGSNHTCRAT